MHRYLRLVFFGLLCSTALLAGCQSSSKGLSAAQVAVLKQHGFQWTDAGWELGLSGKVLFDTDSEVVSSSSQARVTDLIHALLGVGIDQLSLEGHTDNVGSPSYNRQLSLRRAQAVAGVIQAAGLQANKVEVRGLGMSKPIADNSSAEGRSENRRVAIIVSAP